MTNYAQHAYMTEAEREARRKAIEVDQWLKELQQWQGVIVTNLQIWVRSGPSEALRKRISEAGEHYGDCLQRIMASVPERQKVLGR